MSSILTELSAISNIKKTETILPIAGKLAVVTPLTVGDDTALKTSVSSPASLEMELVNLIYKHSEFIDMTMDDTSNKGKKKPADKKFIKPNFQKFISELSIIDKLMLLWGIYKSTYNTLGERQLVCEKCDEINKEDILLDDLLHPTSEEEINKVEGVEESITLFDEKLGNFYDHTEVISLPHKDSHMLEFHIRIPSIQNQINLLKMVSIEKIQENLRKIRQIFDTPQLISLFTKKMVLYSLNKPDERTETSNIQEILTAVDAYLDLPNKSKFLKEYDDKFGKYMVKFYKNFKCKSCGHDQKEYFDIELEFFRRGILD
jgi:hypothetical protein